MIDDIVDRLRPMRELGDRGRHDRAHFGKRRHRAKVAEMEMPFPDHQNDFAESLEGIACITSRAGNADGALRLLGAANALRKALGARRAPPVLARTVAAEDAQLFNRVDADRRGRLELVGAALADAESLASTQWDELLQSRSCDAGALK